MTWVFEKPMWRGLVLRKRALIPADGFYEWKRIAEGNKERKQPFYIRPKHADVCSFAGVWETWKDIEGKELKTYSIITTAPNEEMSSVHNRMPVILHPEDEASWLESSKVSREEIEPFCTPTKTRDLKCMK